jgi:hypothetical protein
MAETPIIHMCLTSRIYERARCWRNRVFSCHFKTFVNCGFPASAKKNSMSQNRIFNALLGPSGGAATDERAVFGEWTPQHRSHDERRFYLLYLHPISYLLSASASSALVEI